MFKLKQQKCFYPNLAILYYDLSLNTYRFNKKEKDIEISMIIDNKQNIEELILNNKVDIAFIEGTVSSKEIILKDIWTDELVFISSINHEWNGKEYLDLEDLKNNKFIIREDGSGTRERFEYFLKDKVESI